MGERVVFIDDDDGIRCVAELLVTSVGIEFEGYDRPLTFLERYRRSDVEPTVIVSDLVMPEMTGLELLCATREREIDLPFIIVSGYADVQVTAEAFRSGALDFLEKPFSKASFLIAIQHALAISRGRIKLLERRRDIARRVSRLTEREAAVLRMLVTGDGPTSKEVGRCLGISHRTVEHHRQQGIKKLGLTSLFELAAPLWLAELKDAASTEPGGPIPPVPVASSLQPRLLRSVHSLEPRRDP